jgi:DNA polymerase
MFNKDRQLINLKNEMLRDKSLPLQESSLVFGEGSSEAEIFFIGEAPGLKEEQLARPFVGRSGQLLTRTIEDLGLSREDVYISNIVKRRPPDNRDPFPSEIEAYQPYLQKQIEIINPKIIVTLGRFSFNYFFPKGKISLDQGKIFKTSSFVLVPMFHPAAALRSTKTLQQFQKSFKKLPSILKKLSI